MDQIAIPKPQTRADAARMLLKLTAFDQQKTAEDAADTLTKAIGDLGDLKCLRAQTDARLAEKRREWEAAQADIAALAQATAPDSNGEEACLAAARSMEGRIAELRDMGSKTLAELSSILEDEKAFLEGLRKGL